MVGRNRRGGKESRKKGLDSRLWGGGGLKEMICILDFLQYVSNFLLDFQQHIPVGERTWMSSTGTHRVTQVHLITLKMTPNSDLQNAEPIKHNYQTHG